jgi:arylsulfatase A-like enzyme/tetratricopeptide (TPR) repeat protein
MTRDSRRRIFLVLIAAAALRTVLLPAASSRSRGPSSASSSDVILITIDTLRADRLGCYGARRVETPAMDALAAEGVRFEDALAQVPITLPSHAVILTGTYPMYNGVRDFTSRGIPPGIGLLAEAFKRQSYETAAFVSAFVLDSTWGFGRGFDTYDDHFDPRQFETRNPGNIQRRADETVDRLLTWLRSRGAGPAAARPFFVWLHLYDPHSEYNPPEPFRARYAGRLYDGEVAYTDSQLARLFAELRRSGLYDRALIALLSDHGESLGEHGEAEHGFFVYNATLRVPLIFKLPRGQAPPRVIQGPVGTIDVAPTLLDLLRVQDPIRQQFQGSSLASLILGQGNPANRPVYAESYYPFNSFGWSPLRSLTTRHYHLIDAPRPEIYDFPADPGETRDLYSQRRADAEALRHQLRDIERRYAPQAPAPEGPPLAPETLEKLKSLGYLAYAAPAAASPPAGDLPDPKDRLKIFKSILRATDLASAGRYEASNSLLASLASEEPRLYLIPFMLAENAARLQRWAEAETEFLASLKLNPSFQQAIMGLARACLAQGKAESARPWLELALHDNPHNFLAYHGLGLAAAAQRNLPEALRNFQKAVAEKPNYAPSQQELGIVLVEMQRYTEALPPLARAAELGPENPLLANYRGTALANTGRLQEAIESYRKALAMKPDFTAARLNLAFACLKLGDLTTARREFQVLCKQSPSLCQQYRSRFE